MWHSTLDSGNDTEFTLVVAALCAGFGYIVTHLIFKPRFIASIFSSVLPHHAAEQFFAFVFGFHPFRFAGTSPPPLPLRI